jgi:hypothetical protein
MFHWKSDEDKFLDGELLFIPEELKDKVENESFRVEKRELIYLVWAVIKSTSPERQRGSWRRVHHQRFNYGSSHFTSREAVLWLAANGFIELDGNNSYYAHPEKGFPKRYRLIHKQTPTLVELENKSLLDGPESYTQNDIPCRYTREVLDQLEVDRDGLKRELRQVIFEYYQLGDFTKNEEKNGQKHENTGENVFSNTEIIEGLYMFGLPLLHLVNRCGAIKRGKKGSRLFSSMTNVKKTFRKYFTLEGEPLIWLDMQAAHPTLLGNLSADQKLVADCISDGFYGRIMEELEVDRETAKKKYMAWAYDVHRPESRMTGIMETYYPQAASYVIKHKQEKYQRFSWEMQRREASIFIDSVYTALAKERVPALSIHDCIGSPPKHRERIKNLILNEMNNRGYTMLIKEEGREEEEPTHTI